MLLMLLAARRMWPFANLSRLVLLNDGHIVDDRVVGDGRLWCRTKHEQQCNRSQQGLQESITVGRCLRLPSLSESRCHR